MELKKIIDSSKKKIIKAHNAFFAGYPEVAENYLVEAHNFLHKYFKMPSDVTELTNTEIPRLRKKHENLRAAVKAYEKQHICRVLNRYNWKKVKAAKAMSLGLSSLYRKIEELEICPDGASVK